MFSKDIFHGAVFNKGYVGKQPVAWKEYCAAYWLKECQESMVRCTGRCDKTEILLKTALNTNQLINHRGVKSRHCVGKELTLSK